MFWAVVMLAVVASEGEVDIDPALLTSQTLGAPSTWEISGYSSLLMLVPSIPICCGKCCLNVQRVGLNFQNLKLVSTVVMLTVGMTIRSTWHGSVDIQGLLKKRGVFGENEDRRLTETIIIVSWDKTSRHVLLRTR
jgi:hypothetical protein